MTHLPLQNKTISWLLAAVIAAQPAWAFSCVCSCATGSPSNSETTLEDAAPSPAKPRDCCHKTPVDEQSGNSSPTCERRLPLSEEQSCPCSGACGCVGDGDEPTTATATLPPQRIGVEPFALATVGSLTFPIDIPANVQPAWCDGVSSFVLSAPRRCTDLCRWLL